MAKRGLAGKNLDPVFRHQRAVKAGDAARRAHVRRAWERAGHLHPCDAWSRGYRVGYQRAAAFWRAKYQRVLKLVREKAA